MSSNWYPPRLLIVFLSACFVAMAPLDDVAAQSVTYSLGAETDLLDSAFYAGVDGTLGTADDRIVLNFGVSNSGTEGVLWGLRLDNGKQRLYRVQIGQPSSWEELTGDENADFDQIVYSPDDSTVFFGKRKGSFANQTIETPTIAGYETNEPTLTMIGDDNWLVSGTPDAIIPDDSQIVYLPILANGDEDTSRTPVVVTNFPFTRPEGVQNPITSCWVSRDGTKVAFMLWDSSGAPDVSDIYLLKNVDSILAAPKIPSTDISSLAPTSLADPNVVEIFTSESNNFAGSPSLSHDGNLVFFNQDMNNLFDYEDFVATFAAGDWDIMIGQADGSGNVRFPSVGHQAVVKPFPTGTRLTYVKAVGGPLNFHVYATTLTASTDIDAESDPLPDGGTSAVINGNSEPLPFTLGDSAVQVSAPTNVEDASGTIVEFPTDQVINFPDGSSATGITITTPIDPVAPIELPDPATQIPVIRTFGPAGTQFHPPISITISYSDAEVSGIFDETQMIPYLYNTTTQEFEPLDEPFLSTVVVDPVANTLTFQTDHFSTYGIGFSATIAPQRPWAVWALAVMLGMLAGVISWKRRKTA